MVNLHIQEKLEWQSSEVDWCEGNFVITRFVAEFYNTVSIELIPSVQGIGWGWGF